MTKTVPLDPNPSGRWGLPAISSLRAVIDVGASISVSRLDLPGKTHRRYYQHLCYRPLRSRSYTNLRYRKLSAANRMK